MRRPEVVFGKFVGKEGGRRRGRERRRATVRFEDEDEHIFFTGNIGLSAFFSTEAFASPQRGLGRSSPVTNGFVKFDRTSERKRDQARRGATKRLVSGVV
jgi:hypothetical protein